MLLCIPCWFALLPQQEASPGIDLRCQVKLHYRLASLCDVNAPDRAPVGVYMSVRVCVFESQSQRVPFLIFFFLQISKENENEVAV